MAENKKLSVVLTSKENFIWESMQEIVPFIEKNWVDSQSDRHEVRVVDVDQTPFPEILSTVFCADNIVLSCFTLKLAKIALVARQTLGVEARFFIYLHNQATIGCWPLREWGPGNILLSRDVFVSSCTRDAVTLGLSVENARVEVLPFSFLNVSEIASAKKRRSIEPLLFSIGRISPQKNIHTLIYSLDFLKRRHGLAPRLKIFGGEDHLGSPNMGIENTRYLTSLLELTKSLGLESQVEFRGHVLREKLIEEVSQTPHVFVSASLHSDENFGMAAFRSLVLGNKAVLSRWGGHVDFQEHFPKQVALVDARESTSGPWIDPRELAEKMALQISSLGVAEAEELPRYYRPSFIAEQVQTLALETVSTGEPLRYTELADQVWKNWKKYKKDSPRRCKIFSSYSDTAASAFFRGYGMRSSSEAEKYSSSRESKYAPLPWIQIGEGQIRIEDPHRGLFQFHWSHESEPGKVPEDLLARLGDLGFTLR
ncbi:glycosyltransferase [bacterium]|jgi:glycosyltransferase involved in cell wall biosynthesis|nr:glycosyltransferase [bacterium]